MYERCIGKVNWGTIERDLNGISSILGKSLITNVYVLEEDGCQKGILSVLHEVSMRSHHREEEEEGPQKSIRHQF